MSRRDEIPIAQATVWDVIDWPVVAALASQAPSDKYGLVGRPDLALPWAAATLISIGSQKESDNRCRFRLCEIFAALAWGQSNQAKRRQLAAELGQKLGADAERFIDLLTKYGEFS